jgi:hypothetical protein
VGFSWDTTENPTNTSVGNAGSRQFKVKFTPSDTANYNVVSNIPVTVTVSKAVAPSITWPTATPITYGAALQTSTLSGGSTAYGTFAWTDGAIIPTVVNSGYSVTFTPSESTLANYEAITPLTQNVAITVGKAAQPVLTINGLDDSYSYGDAPFSLSTSGGGGSGAVSYVSDTTDVADVSGNTVTIRKVGTFRITATKVADGNYNQALTTSDAVTVRESTPNVALVASGGGVYGDDITLIATVSRVNTGAIPGGTVTFKEGGATLGTATLDGSGVATFTVKGANVGSHTYTADYSGEAGRYKASSGTVTVTISPAAGGDPDANADQPGLDSQTPTGPAVDAPANVVKIRSPLTTVYLTKNKTYKIPYVLDTVNGKAISDSKLKITSSKPKIAKVVKSGTTYKIKGLKNGKATITIKAQNGRKATIKVVVQKKNIVLKKFAVKAPKSLKKGKTYQLKISNRTKKASNISTVTFKSSNRKIATVDKAGKIKAVKNGKVKITIKVGKKKITKTIRIK